MKENFNLDDYDKIDYLNEEVYESNDALIEEDDFVEVMNEDIELNKEDYERYFKGQTNIGSDVDIEYSEEEMVYIIEENIKFMKRVTADIYDSTVAKTKDLSAIDPVMLQVTIGDICYKQKQKTIGGNAQNQRLAQIHRNNLIIYDKVLVRLARDESDSHKRKDAEQLLIMEHIKYFYGYAYKFKTIQNEDTITMYTTSDVLMEIIKRFIEIIKNLFDTTKNVAINTYFTVEIKKIFAKIRGNSKAIKIDDNKIFASDQVNKVRNTLKKYGVDKPNSIVIADYMNLRTYCDGNDNQREVTPLNITNIIQLNEINNKASLDKMESEKEMFSSESYSSADIYKNPALVAVNNERKSFVMSLIENRLTKLQAKVYKLYLALSEEEEEYKRMKSILNRDLSLSLEEKSQAREILDKQFAEVFTHAPTIPKEIAARLKIRVADVTGFISDANRLLRESPEMKSYYGKDRIRLEKSAVEGGGLIDVLIGGIEINTW